MLHPTMTIRPDDVIRSGIIQPFGVRATNPVAFARHEIDPFIQAIRPMASQYAPVRMDGSLGIVTTQNMPLMGLGAMAAADKTKYLWAAGGVALGVLGGFFLGRAIR